MNRIYALMALFLLSLLSVSSTISAQEKEESAAKGKEFIIEGLISKDKVYDRGTYTVENNVKVVKGANLTFKAGSQILFRKGVSIKVEGGLLLEGSKLTFIEVRSEDKEEEGLGFIFSGVNNDRDVSITYTKFSNLLAPLNFEKNWTRRSVKIENNIFQDIVLAGEPAISVKAPDNIASLEQIPFNFISNNFIGNNSRIYIENIESDVLVLKFKYNLITSNYFYGTDVETNSPIYTNFDKRDYRNQAEFLGNSLYLNFQRDEKTDTIVKEINFGIRGIGETLNLDGNYFGNKSTGDLQNSFDHFNNFQGAPFIVVNTPLASPSNQVHGHIWRVEFNEVEVPNFSKLPVIEKTPLEISLFSNRSFLLIKQIQYLTYTFFDVALKKVKTIDVVFTYKLDSNGTILRLTVTDDIYSKNTIGYFTIKGLRDDEGFEVPQVLIGKERFNYYLMKNEISAEEEE